MPNIFSKWIDKKLCNTKEKQPLLLPALPQVRPRVLTPSPSQVSLVLFAAAVTAHGAFFQKLPMKYGARFSKKLLATSPCIWIFVWIFRWYPPHPPTGSRTSWSIVVVFGNPFRVEEVLCHRELRRWSWTTLRPLSIQDIVMPISKRHRRNQGSVSQQR